MSLPVILPCRIGVLAISTLHIANIEPEGLVGKLSRELLPLVRLLACSLPGARG